MRYKKRTLAELGEAVASSHAGKLHQSIAFDDQVALAGTLAA